MMGGVHGRAGGFDVDQNLMRQVTADLRKLDGGFGDINIEEEKKEEAPDNRSMMQVMQDKRKAAEAEVAAAKANQPAAQAETIEERKARMLAQRDILRKMKEEKRQQELNEFNQKMADGNTATDRNLAEEFKQMDANKQLPKGDNPEMDRRRMIYKNVRKEISEADKLQKQKTYSEKM